MLPTSSARVASDRAIGMFKQCDEVACKAFGERSLQRADIANELGTMLTEYNMLKVRRCAVAVDPRTSRAGGGGKARMQ